MRPGIVDAGDCGCRGNSGGAQAGGNRQDRLFLAKGDQPARFKDHQFVHRSNRTGPVRHDDHRRSGLPQRGNGLGQGIIAGHIQIGVRLVQHHDGGQSKDRAGQPQPLYLSTRQLDPVTAAQLRGIAIGQFQDHLVYASQPGGGDHIGIIGGRIKAGDIVADRAGQQAHGLRQIADLAAQLDRIPLVRRRPVQPDFALIRAQRPHQQPGEGGFAASRIANHPQPVARVQDKTDVGQDARLFRSGPARTRPGRTRPGRIRPGRAKPGSAKPGQAAHADLPGGVGQGDGRGL